MTSSVDLTLDNETETTIRGEWEALRRAGFSNLAAHPAASNRPHITLVAGSSLRLDPGAVDAALPIPVTIGAPVLFGSGERRVLARLVTPSPALLDLQAAVHAALGSGADDEHTNPGSWLSHITLARRLRLDDLVPALRLLGNTHAGEVVGMRLWNATDGTETRL